MSRQGTIRRYTLIIEKINSGQYPSFREILDYLEQFGFELSKRTVERDFGAIRDEFGIEITYDRYKDGYFIDKENSINMESFIRFLEIVNTANLLTDSLSDSRQSLDYIAFDQQGSLKGIEHLSSVLKAIKEHRKMNLVHHTFHGKKAHKFKVEPYLLKEYQNRWYIVAFVLGMNEPRTFAIDRLEKVEILDETFKPTKRDELLANFNHVIGLVYSYGEIEDVELVFTQQQGNYVKSLPWHSSQTILVDNELELRIKLRVIPNFELTQKILMCGDSVEVIHPLWLRTEIKKSIRKSLEKYG